jgi:cytochrome c oxidase cbb3-type subunit I/II
MYWSGLTQGLMWKQFTPQGLLQYPNFLETTLQIIPMYIIRAFGGLLFFCSLFIMIYNLVKTAKQGSFLANEEAEAAPLEKKSEPFNKKHPHTWLESRPIQFMLLAAVAILIGGIVEFVPTFLIKSNIPTIASVKPYTPLELQGRDLYIREGCNACHSQLVRPFRSETARFGEYSKAGEYVYDHPFLWGSKRTGPDLHREGGKFPNAWHFNHMNDPTSMSPGSIMPPFPWLAADELDNSSLSDKISALRKIGVPYPEGFENTALQNLKTQAKEITKDLNMNGAAIDQDRELIALIAYLQRLGKDIKAVQNTVK